MALRTTLVLVFLALTLFVLGYRSSEPEARAAEVPAFTEAMPADPGVALVTLGELFEVRAAVAGDRAEVSAGTPTLALERGSALSLTLEVMDEGGRPLPSLELFSTVDRAGPMHPGPMHPGNDGRLGTFIAGEPSPVRLAVEWLDEPALWLTAPGRVAQRLEVSPEELAAGVVQRTLGSGGGLDVALFDRGPECDLALAIARLEPYETWVELHPAGADDFHFEGLPPGEYRVALAPPGWSRSIPVVWTQVEIEATRTSRAELTCPPTPEAESRGSLFGTLLLSPELVQAFDGKGELKLQFLPWIEGQGAPLRVAYAAHLHGPEGWQGGGALPFETPDLSVGRYRLVLHPFGYVWETTIYPGRTELELVSAPPARTLLYVTESSSGELLRPTTVRARISQAGELPGQASRWPGGVARPSAEEDGAIEILSAPGRLRVFVHDGRFGSLLREFDAQSGWNLLEVEVERTFSCSIRLETPDGPSMPRASGGRAFRSSRPGGTSRSPSWPTCGPPVPRLTKSASYACASAGRGTTASDCLPWGALTCPIKCSRSARARPAPSC
jgi:hypothetical protein